MHEPFTRARELANRRVRMVFDDGHVVVAVLHSAPTDMDGSLHLVYEEVKSTSKDYPTVEGGEYFYAQGETLVSIKSTSEEA